VFNRGLARNFGVSEPVRHDRRADSGQLDRVDRLPQCERRELAYGI
jgi:hypothetical protein